MTNIFFSVLCQFELGHTLYPRQVLSVQIVKHTGQPLATLRMIYFNETGKFTTLQFEVKYSITIYVTVLQINSYFSTIP